MSELIKFKSLFGLYGKQTRCIGCNPYNSLLSDILQPNPTTSELRSDSPASDPLASSSYCGPVGGWLGLAGTYCKIKCFRLTHLDITTKH